MAEGWSVSIWVQLRPQPLADGQCRSCIELTPDTGLGLCSVEVWKVSAAVNSYPDCVTIERQGGAAG